jgi:hypothetical protein
MQGRCQLFSSFLRQRPDELAGLGLPADRQNLEITVELGFRHDVSDRRQKNREGDAAEREAPSASRTLELLWA